MATEPTSSTPPPPPPEPPPYDMASLERMLTLPCPPPADWDGFADDALDE